MQCQTHIFNSVIFNIPKLVKRQSKSAFIILHCSYLLGDILLYLVLHSDNNNYVRLLFLHQTESNNYLGINRYITEVLTIWIQNYF